MNGRCYLVDENTTRAIVSQLRRLQPNMVIGIVGDDTMFVDMRNTNHAGLQTCRPHGPVANK